MKNLMIQKNQTKKILTMTIQSYERVRTTVLMKKKQRPFTTYTRNSNEKSFTNKYRDQIENANDVLVVGGGATGVEFLGEMVTHFGNSKSFGIVHRNERLLSYFPENSGSRAQSYFMNRGVTILDGINFHDKRNVCDEYDYVIMCAGVRYHTPFLNNNTFKECTDELGRIFVNKYFQVTNIDPYQSEEDDRQINEKVFENIFCYGDASTTKMKEVKNVFSIIQTRDIIARNLYIHAYGNQNMYSMPDAIDFITGVRFGTFAGVLVL